MRVCNVMLSSGIFSETNSFWETLRGGVWGLSKQLRLLGNDTIGVLETCCNVLQCVAVCRSVLRRVVNLKAKETMDHLKFMKKSNHLKFTEKNEHRRFTFPCMRNSINHSGRTDVMCLKLE